MNTIEPEGFLALYGGTILLLLLTGLALLYPTIKRYRDGVKDRRERNVVQETDIDIDIPDIPTNMLAGSEEYAAIATVIHLYHNELHDQEYTIMTINKVARAYSPWNAKFHSLNHYFFNKRR